MNNVCIYTCITGNYDKLQEPLVYNKDIDYICFTDDMHIKSRYWNILSMPVELRYLPIIKQQRILKICPHKYLPEYQTSVWIDGNMKICKSIDQFIAEYDLAKCPLYVRIHPARNCIYKEAKAVIEHGKADPAVVKQQIDKYHKEGYPENLGLAETGVLLRAHNDIRCKMLCNTWAEEVLIYSQRDQLSFNYACWKQKFIPGILTNEFNANNAFFALTPHLDK